MPPKDHVMRLTDMAWRHIWGILHQWLYGGTEGCQQVQFAISISVWARSKHLFMCEGEWKNDSLYLELHDEVRDMVWRYYGKTLFVKNWLWMLWRDVSDCPPGFMTGTNCNSHDVIYLKRRTFFRNSLQYCTGTKKTNIRWASFSAYTTRPCVKFLDDFKSYTFNAWIPKSAHFIIDTHCGWEAWLNSDDYIIIEMFDLCTYSDNPNSHTD